MNPGTAISFDGNSLQTPNIVTSDIDHHDIPTKDVKMYALAHGNLSAIPYSSYPSRTIPVTGKIFGSTVIDLDSRIDTLKGYLVGTNKNLDIGYAGSTRRYIATLNKTAIKRPNGLLWASYNLEFVCTNPFGMNTSTTTAYNATARTAAAYHDNSYTFLGSAPYQWPIFTITYTAITGGTNQTVSVGNDGNGQQINITRTWATNDVLVIDTTLSTSTPVTVNGLPVNFTGAFPAFPPGTPTIGYADGFTTRTLNYNVIYTQMYL